MKSFITKPLFIAFLFSVISSNTHAQKRMNDIASLNGATLYFMKQTSFPQAMIDSNYSGTVIVSAKIRNKEVLEVKTILAQSFVLDDLVKYQINKSTGKWSVFKDKEATVILTFNFSSEYECPSKITRIRDYQVNTPTEKQMAELEGAIFIRPIMVIMTGGCF